MKKIAGILISVMLLSGAFSSVLAEDIHVLLDGETMAFTDAQPVIVNDRTMVPMRAIFEALGATIKWDEKTSRVEAVFEDGTHILLYIGKKTAYKNGTSSTLDAEPFLKDDRTFVPLRFVAESSGASVQWDGDTSTVSIKPQWKATSFIPFGEFMGIPAPSSANKSFKVIDYKNEGGRATVTYDVSAVEPDDMIKYERYLVDFGFTQVSGTAVDNDKTFYNGDYVLKTSLSDQTGTLLYTVVLYQDKGGSTIKDDLAG